MDNVIPFPKVNNNPNATPLDLEDVELKIQQLKAHHINETLSTVIPMLFSYLEAAGFTFAELDEDEDGELDGEDIKDGAFMVEAIRSLLCKHHELNHPFQEISEHIFEPDLMHKGVFSLAKKIHIEFKNLDLEKGNS